MWLLPLDLSSLQVAIPEGHHEVPWYLDREESRRLMALLRGVLPKVEHCVELTAEAFLGVAAERTWSLDNCLVLIRIVERDLEEEGSEARISRALSNLSCRYLFVHRPHPVEPPTHYGWREQWLKEPILTAVRRHLCSEDHPLAAFGVRNLPVVAASTFSPDPLEVLDLLEDTLFHRLRYSQDGTSPDDYYRSLLVAVGSRLARRLRALSGDERGAAFEVLFSHHEDTVGNSRQLSQGAAALQRIGLAFFASGNLLLSPLARRRMEPLIHASLMKDMPAAGWAERKRALKHRLQPQQKRSGEAAGQTPEPTRNTPPPISDAGGVDSAALYSRVLAAAGADEIFHTAVTILGQLSAATTMLGGEGLGAERRKRLVVVLRHLEVSEREVGGDGANVLAMLRSALRFWSVTGGGVLEVQDRCVMEIERTAKWDEAVDKAVYLSACLRFLRALVDQPRGQSDLERAEHLCDRCFTLVAPGTVMAARLLLERGRVASRLGRYEDACRDYSEALITLGEAKELMALSECYHELAQIFLSRGEFEQAMELLEKVHDIDSGGNLKSSEAWSYRQYAEQKIATDSWDVALAWLDKSDLICKQIGCRVGQAATYRYRGVVARKRGDLDGATESLNEALKLAASLSARETAYSFQELGIVALGQGDFDQALEWCRKAVETWERLGDCAAKSVALHQFGDVAHRRGNLEEALDWYRKSLDISKGVVRRPDMARTYEALGIVHSELGNHEEALLCLLQGLVLRLEMKAPLRPTLDQIKQQRRALGETAYQEVLRKADGLTRRSEEVVAAIEAE